MKKQLPPVKRMVLIFDNKRELDFIVFKLKEIGIMTYSSDEIINGINKIKDLKPQMVVINMGIDGDISVGINEEIKKISKEEMKVLHIVIPQKIKSENVVPVLCNNENEFYISKPIRPKLLLSVIKNIINDEDINWFA